MKFKLPLICFAGILVMLFYCVFTFISLALFPLPYSPIDNWLSDLGNSGYNPNGAIFYNIGCILTGSALFPFYTGLYKWYREERWYKIFMIIIQFIGCFSGFAEIMIGVFSEDFYREHVFWSNVFFIVLLILLILGSMALFLHPKFIKTIGIYGIIVCMIGILFVFFAWTPLIEWFMSFSAQGYVALIVYNSWKIIE